MTQEQLGRLIGASRWEVHRLETGKVMNPHLQVVLRLMRELEVDSLELLFAGLEQFPTQALASALPPLTPDGGGSPHGTS
jgi:DNA-binding XRE family transcriptional regulator